MNMAVGRLPHGGRNLISDVPGVRVGHTTVDREACHTGVTVVLPPCRNPFRDKLTAALSPAPDPIPEDALRLPDHPRPHRGFHARLRRGCDRRRCIAVRDRSQTFFCASLLPK